MDLWNTHMPLSGKDSDCTAMEVECIRQNGHPKKIWLIDVICCIQIGSGTDSPG